jgi:CubicO group peptidase (beta-lactamase class C family)
VTGGPTLSTEVEGLIEPGFEGVAKAFQANFEQHGDVGAAFCLHVGGRKVIDVWGGTADPAQGRPYGEDTLQVVFSATKGATAACAMLLAQRGLLDVDAPVTTYWPEFGQAGKDRIPVRWLLCHKAGLPTFDTKLTRAQALAWDPVIDALAIQDPFWEPGTAHGYHAITYGYLVGEVVRRIDGRSVGQFFADEIAGPLGLDFWIGLPAEQEARVAPIIAAAPPTDPQILAVMAEFAGPDSLMGRALSLNGSLALPHDYNTPEVHASEIPAAAGITTARSLSRMYAGLIGAVEGGPSAALLTEAQIDAARTLQTSGADRIISFMPGVEVGTTFGLGFMLSSAFSPYGGARSFGHTGAGGSVGFADPENGLGFGYVMNRMMQSPTGDPRTQGLIQASYDAIGAPVAFL